MNHVFKVKVNDTLWHLVVEDEEDEKPNRLEIRVITKKPHTEIGLELPAEKCHLCKQKMYKWILYCTLLLEASW